MASETSLQNLNDIVLPPPVGWWPPAPGWYLLAMLLLVVLIFGLVRYWRRWQGDAYRRQALAELASLRLQGPEPGWQQLPGLLKRTALAAWSREEVAGLTGPEWHGFLDQTAGIENFRGGAGATLDRLAYAGSSVSMPGDPELAELLSAAETWLKKHRPSRAGG
jgi:hypothetical protein